MKEIVLDNSVISAYAKIGRLNLLKELLKGTHTYIPGTVHREMIHQEALSAVKSKTNPDGWITIIEVDISEYPGSMLGAGEAGTIKLAREKNAIAAIDDLPGRKQAAKEGVQLIGTLALLRLASSRGLIIREELESALVDLEGKDSFRMSAELKNWVLGKK